MTDQPKIPGQDRPQGGMTDSQRLKILDRAFDDSVTAYEALSQRVKALQTAHVGLQRQVNNLKLRLEQHEYREDAHD